MLAFLIWQVSMLFLGSLMLLASLLLLVYMMLTMFLLLTKFLWLTIFLLFQLSAVAGGPIKLLDHSNQTGNFFCYRILVFFNYA
jgi:hypothetical protein